MSGTTPNFKQVAPHVGTKIKGGKAEYTLVKPLGEPGGQGVVWEAACTPVGNAKMPHRCAIKLYTNPAGGSTTPPWSREFELMKPLASATPPIAPRVYEVGQVGETGFLAMDLAGDTLASFISGPHHSLPAAHAWSFDDRLRIAKMLTDAVATLHRVHHVLHRDIKPANILIERDFRGAPSKVLLIDFGIGRDTENAGAYGRTVTSHGLIAGTYPYMAPELLDGVREADERTDLLALGIVLHELFTGCRLWSVDASKVSDPLDQARAFWDGPCHPRAADLLDSAPSPMPYTNDQELARAAKALRGWLGRVLLSATHAEPQHRHRNLAELSEDLTTAESGALLHADTSLGTLQDPWIRPRYRSSIQNYAALIAGASALIEAEDHARAARVLQQTSPGRRSWEYHYLLNRTSGHLLFGSAHMGSIRTISWSPCGKVALTGSYDDTARLWDTCTGSPLGVPMQHARYVSHAIFSPDGEHVLTCSDDSTARLWDGRTGEPVSHPMRHEGIIKARYCANGKGVVTTCINNISWLWDGRTGKALANFVRHESVIYSVVSDDGTHIATVSHDNMLLVHNTATGEPVGTPLPHIRHAVFGPDGSRFVTYSLDLTAQLWNTRACTALGDPMPGVSRAVFSPDGTLMLTYSGYGACLWDTGTGVLISDSLRHAHRINDIAFSPDGLRVVTASSDNTARIWNTRTGSPMGSPMKHDSEVTGITFSPSGEHLVTCTREQIAQLWDGRTGASISNPLRHKDTIDSAVFNATGTRLITCVGHTTHMWDGRTGVPVCEPLQMACQAAFSPDGDFLLTCGGRTARICESRTGTPMESHVRPQTPISLALFSPDSERVLTYSDNLTGRLWDTRTGSPTGPPMEHRGFVRHTLFSPDGERVLTCADDHTARLWDGRTGVPISDPVQYDHAICCALLRPQGFQVITASLDGVAQLRDGSTGTALGACLTHINNIVYAVFSPDGGRILTRSDNTAQVWNASTGEAIGEPMCHGDWIGHAAFSPDGLRLVTVSKDKTARLWHGQSGLPLSEPMQHAGWVRHAAFSPDGERLLTSVYDDNCVRLWDGRTGVRLGDPMRHDGVVGRAVFSRDGERIVTSANSRVWLWHARTGCEICTVPGFHEFCLDPRGRFMAVWNEKSLRVLDSRSSEERGADWRGGETSERRRAVRGMAQTIVFGLRARGLSDDEIKQRTANMTELDRDIRDALRAFLEDQEPTV